MTDLLIAGCDIDYSILKSGNINEDFFADYSNQRIINSFLFNYIKIQDRIGAKFFKSVLYELKEISDYDLPMIDVLNNLEKLGIMGSSDDWDRLREIRNIITHEYPQEIEERIENINLALQGYAMLKSIYTKIKEYCLKKNII